jgi:hypothetical protein
MQQGECGEGLDDRNKLPAHGSSVRPTIIGGNPKKADDGELFKHGFNVPKYMKPAEKPQGVYRAFNWDDPGLPGRLMTCQLINDDFVPFDSPEALLGKRITWYKRLLTSIVIIRMKVFLEKYIWNTINPWIDTVRVRIIKRVS